VHYISNLTSGIPSVKEPGAQAEDGEHFASALEMNNGSFDNSKAARVVIHSGPPVQTACSEAEMKFTRRAV
jgi:hypothetical protein